MIAREDTDILLALGEAARDTRAWNQGAGLAAHQMQASTPRFTAATGCIGAPLPRPACFDALRPNRVMVARNWPIAPGRSTPISARATTA